MIYVWFFSACVSDDKQMVGIRGGHRLHFLGLVSDGGVHSHYEHLIALANAAHTAGVTDIFVHAFTDGRDTSPTGGADFLKACSNGQLLFRRALVIHRARRQRHRLGIHGGVKSFSSGVFKPGLISDV